MAKKFTIYAWTPDGKTVVKIKGPIHPSRIVDDPRLKGWTDAKK